MKLRYKILYMSFGAGLVVLGMVLNSLVSGDAEAQGGVKDATFRSITCGALFIADVLVDGSKPRGEFGLDTTGSASLKILGDDGEKVIAYLGGNVKEKNQMKFVLQSKSKTDKRETSIMIDENGGRFDSHNKIGESVNRLEVGSDGGGSLDVRVKYENKK